MKLDILSKKIESMQLQKENIPFTMVANEVLRDPRLSWKAKGMYSYLFSKPDDWDFAHRRIMQESSDGRHAVLSALRELEDLGLLVREKLPSGRMVYNLKHSTGQSPKTGLRLFDITPHEKPESENPKVRKPEGAKTGPISNTDKQVIQNTSNTLAPQSGAPFSLPEEVRKLEESPRRDLNIIALYFDERKPKFESYEQYQVALKRHLRAARMLSPFTDPQIVKAAREAKQQYPGWTIETLVKLVTK